MNKLINRFGLFVLLFISGISLTEAQTLTLSNNVPGGDPLDAFDGNVFQVGNQIGDAYIYAQLSANAPSFQIFSPGENQTKTITSSGGFNIRPTTSMVVDKSKILNFSGTITGSVAINVKPLSITTISANVSGETNPGAELTVSYFTGSGSFPVELAIGKFKVQLLDANGNFLYDLLNSTDQYAGRERFSSSFGGTRFIKATIPVTTSPGTYRVRVVTQGLNTNVFGSSSSQFSIRVNTPTILAGSLGTSNFCAGTAVSFPFTTTGTFSTNDSFKVQITNGAGSVIQDLVETSVSSPVRATLPATLNSGSYRFKLISTTTGVVSNTSTINVLAQPTMTISGNSTIQSGATAPIQLTFTGTSPWSFDYVDYKSDFAPSYTRSITSTPSSLTINPTLYSTTLYDKSFTRNFRDANCGTYGNINGSAQITVNQITVTTGSLSGTYCPGSAISVPFTVSSPLPIDAVPLVQISDANGSFQNAQVIGSGNRTGPVNSIIPQSLVSGGGYKLRVVLQTSNGQGAIDYNSLINPIASSLIISRPNAPQVSDIDFCQGSSIRPLTATGTNLKWYTPGVAQSATIAPIPPNDRSSQYTVSQTVDGCESTLAILKVNMQTTPSAPSINGITLCQGAQAQFSTSITGVLWYTSLTGGVGSSQPPSLNNQITGNQTVYVTQTINECESPRAAVIATVYSIPSAPTIQTPTPLCQYVIANQLSAGGQNLTWYDQSGKLAGSPIPETNSSGTKSYSVSQTVNGCESPRASLEQRINPASPTPVANGTRYCVNDVPRPLTAIGSNIKWYSTLAGGSASSISPAFFTETANVFTFYVTQTDSTGCESQRLPVSVSVVAAPSPPTVTASQAVCQFTKVNPLTASPNTGLVWQGSGISGTSDTSPTPVTTQPGTFTYVVSQKAGSCTSLPSFITFTVNKLPDAPIVASPATFCIGQNAAPLTAVASGQLTWYTNSDHNGFSSSQVVVNTTTSAITTYYVTQTDVNKCESLNSALEVRVSAKATARLTGDGSINPGDSTAIRVRLTGDGPWTFTNWEAKQITTTDSLYVKWEKPTSPRTYAITNLRSSCGVGDILNDYPIRVNAPLGIKSMTEPILLKTYPNPTTGDVSIEWSSPTRQEINFQIINAEGKIIKDVSRQSTNVSQTELFQLGNQPTGTYILRVISLKNSVLARPILKH